MLRAASIGARDAFSYLNKAREIASMLRNKPMPPEATVLKYTEYAAHYDVAQSLDLYGRHMPFYALYNLDVLAALGVIITLLFAALLLLARSCWRCARARRRAAKSKSE